MNTLIKFPSIEIFRSIKRNVEWAAQFQGLDKDNQPIINRLAVLPKLQFIGTEKLHGSCCSIIINSDKSFYCQSRERIIQPGDDNYGFAGFINNVFSVNSHLIDFFISLAHGFKKLAIYGEWCGKGIQQTVAVSKVDKFWSIFAIKAIYEGENEDETDGKWLDLAAADYSFLNNHRIFNIYQKKTWEVEIDFEHPAESVELINNLTLEVEKESPFGQMFGISGIGEGIVFHCVTQGFESSKFWFKNKGSEHSKSHVKHLAGIDVEKSKSADAFVDKHINNERLTQGFNHLKENKLFNFEHPERSLGDFLKWLFNDIIKEESDELEASGLKLKDINSFVAKKAKLWYFTEIAKN